MSQERGYAPIPGKSRIFLITSIVFVAGFGVPFVIIAVLAIFNPDLVPTLGGLSVPVLVAVAMVIGAVLQRRAYLRDARSGNVIERKPWEPDIPHSW